MKPITRRHALRAAGLGSLGLLMTKAQQGLAAKEIVFDSESIKVDTCAYSYATYADSAKRHGYKVLEIYLVGGLSPWETFYIRARDGGPWAEWRGKRPQFRSRLSWQTAARRAGYSEADGDLEEIGSSATEFAPDEAGHMISLGPATRPLWPWLNRMRVLTMRHDLLPHDAAIPLALTGLRLGHPRMAGIGATIQAEWLERGTSSNLPLAYVLQPNYFAPNRLTPASATGMHPGHARPLTLRIDGRSSSARMFAALGRPNVRAGGARDHLLNMFRQAYQADLSDRVSGRAVPSAELSSYSASLTRLQNAAALREILGENPPEAEELTPVPEPTGFKPMAARFNTGAALDLAATLLNANCGASTRYVNVIDGGLDSRQFGYDTHEGNSVITSINLYATLSHLAGLIRRGRINLNDTLIFINTEFGRLNFEFTDGRSHHPHGYTTVLLGGAITSPAVFGSVDDNGAATNTSKMADSVGFLTPAHAAAAVALAAGVEPFGSRKFAVGDFKDEPDEGTVRRKLGRIVNIGV